MGGRLIEAGHLLTFSALRMGAHLWWVLILGWAPIRINNGHEYMGMLENSNTTNN